MSAHGELICGNFGDCVNLPGGYRCDCREGSGLQVNYSSLILNQYKRKFLMNSTRVYFKTLILRLQMYVMYLFYNSISNLIFALRLNIT